MWVSPIIVPKGHMNKLCPRFMNSRPNYVTFNMLRPINTHSKYETLVFPPLVIGGMSFVTERRDSGTKRRASTLIYQA